MAGIRMLMYMLWHKSLSSIVFVLPLNCNRQGDRSFIGSQFTWFDVTNFHMTRTTPADPQTLYHITQCGPCNQLYIASVVKPGQKLLFHETCRETLQFVCQFLRWQMCGWNFIVEICVRYCKSLGRLCTVVSASRLNRIQLDWRWLGLCVWRNWCYMFGTVWLPESKPLRTTSWFTYSLWHVLLTKNHMKSLHRLSKHCQLLMWLNKFRSAA